MALFEKFVDTIFLKEDSSLERELEALKEIKDKVIEKEKELRKGLKEKKTKKHRY